MKITEIVDYINKRVYIYTDTGISFHIKKRYLKELGLYIDKELDQDQYSYIINNILYPEARDKSLNYLSYKPRTVKEIQEYLNKARYKHELIQAVLEFLIEYNYVNDYNYAKMYVGSYVERKPIGVNMIYYNLGKKGIKRDVVQKALYEVEFDEEEHAYTLIKKRLRNVSNLDYKEEAKVKKYLSQKGFEYGSIRRAMERYKALS